MGGNRVCHDIIYMVFYKVLYVSTPAETCSFRKAIRVTKYSYRRGEGGGGAGSHKEIHSLTHSILKYQGD